MIDVCELTKKYGNRYAVDHISFHVGEGDIVGFLGPNGAGKTTTMNMITGYISTSEGQVLIDGFDILEQPIEAKKRIGYLPEHPPLYMDMLVEEYLAFVFALKKVKDFRQEEHLSAIMEMTGIADVRQRLIRNLSKGYQQRVGIAQALIGNPKVLILDEPTVGLDPNQIIEIRNLIADLGKKHTVILSSHILSEISAICQKVIILNNGKIVAMDYTENLLKRVNHTNALLVRIPGDTQKVLHILNSFSGVVQAEIEKQVDEEVFDYQVVLEEASQLQQELSIKLAQEGISVLMIKNADTTLEEVFAKFTAKEETEDAGDL